jgi:hypothetical protein
MNKDKRKGVTMATIEKKNRKIGEPYISVGLFDDHRSGKLLLVLGSTVILRFDYHETDNYSFLSRNSGSHTITFSI